MIAVFTLTRERLYYTKTCFDLLNRKAGMDFKHIVIDNGSKDGTVEWLKEYNAYRKVYLPENKGLKYGVNLAFEIIKEIKDIDFILKFDNDCEVLTEGFLRELVEAYNLIGGKVLLSPYVKGIVNQVKRTRYVKIGEYTYGNVGHLGGICLFMPREFLEEIGWEIKAKLPYARGVDSYLSSKARKLGYNLFYVENIFVKHIELSLIHI